MRKIKPVLVYLANPRANVHTYSDTYTNLYIYTHTHIHIHIDTHTLSLNISSPSLFPTRNPPNTHSLSLTHTHKHTHTHYYIFFFDRAEQEKGLDVFWLNYSYSPKIVYLTGNFLSFLMSHCAFNLRWGMALGVLIMTYSSLCSKLLIRLSYSILHVFNSRGNWTWNLLIMKGLTTRTERHHLIFKLTLLYLDGHT